MSTLVKVLVDRPRPEVDHPIATAFGKSFPSGHALSSTVVFGALLLTFLPVLSRRWRHVAVAFTVVLVLAIGASRLLLGVHFVSDVVGGYVLGIAWLLTATAIFEIWRVERGQRPSHPLEEGVEPEEAGDLRPEESVEVSHR
jgi:undecaprenyl-diphosphatase